MRAAQGRVPIVLDPILTKAAENHAKYLDMNNITDFQSELEAEYKGKPGYTGDGPQYRAISVGEDPNYMGIAYSEQNYLWGEGSIEEVLDKVLPRGYNIMKYGSMKIGIGQSGDKTVFLMKSEIETQGTDKPNWYPYNGQTGVEVKYEPRDGLDRTLQAASKGAATGLSGHPIRHTYPSGIEVGNGGKQSVLYDSKNQVVPVYTFDGDMYPKDILKPGETYTAKVSYKLKSGETRTDTMSFTTEGGATVTPPPVEKPKPVFTDFATGKYWSESSLWAVEKGILAGYKTTGDNNYLLKPYDQLTEAQLLTVMFRYLEPAQMEAYKNINPNFFAEGAYKIAESKGLPVNRATANQPITRGYMAQLLASAHFNKEVSVRDAVQFMYDSGLSNGFSSTEKTYDTYGVNNILLRGQVASFFMKYDELLK
jgi:hypothetical protein